MSGRWRDPALFCWYGTRVAAYLMQSFWMPLCGAFLTSCEFALLLLGEYGPRLLRLHGVPAGARDPHTPAAGHPPGLRPWLCQRRLLWSASFCIYLDLQVKKWRLQVKSNAFLTSVQTAGATGTTI